MRTTNTKQARAEVKYQLNQFTGKGGALARRTTVSETVNRCGKPMRAERSAE